MSNITEDKLRQDIRNLKIESLYLFYGEEKYLIKFYVNRIKKNCLGSKYSDFDFSLFSFNANKLNIDIIRDSMMFPPVLSPKKLIIIEDFPFSSISADESEEFINLLTNIPPYLTVIISQIIDNNSVKKSGPAKKIFQIIDKYGNTIEFKRKNSYEISKQLVKWANKYGAVLLDDNARKIVDYSSRDYLTLSNELKKLCAFVGSGEITEDVIDKIMSKNLTANVFEISTDIFKGNYSRAYEGLHFLLNNKEDPIMIVAAIASIFIDIYRLKIAIIQKKDTKDIVRSFDYKNKEFKLKKAGEYLKIFSLDKIRFIIKILNETDMKLKSSSINPQVLLEIMVLKIIIAKIQCQNLKSTE